MGTRGGQNRMSPVFMGSRSHFSMPEIFHGQSLHALFFSCNFAAEIYFNAMRSTKNIFFLLANMIFVACLLGCSQGHPYELKEMPDARSCYDKALLAFDADSIRLGEDLLHKAILLAEVEEDLHTLYLSQMQMAKSLSWSNTEAALDMARQALTTYQRHPDNERNYIILLDYVGTYAGQVAYNNDTSFDEALTYTRKAHALAEAMSDSTKQELVSQTLTSLANIYWAMEKYDEALVFARQGANCAPSNLLLGAQQVLARCLVSCDSLARAEEIYKQMEPGNDLQAAYIVESNLAKLALQRNDIEAAENTIDEAFGHAEDLYFNALKQKDEYYQTALQQEHENERLRYTSLLHRRTMWGVLFFILIAAIATYMVGRSRFQMMRQRRLADAWARKHEVDQRLHEAALQRKELEAQRLLVRQREATISFLKEFIYQRSEIIKKLGDNEDEHVIISDHDWLEVEQTLNSIDHDRFKRLREKYPDLREEDVQLCILTNLHLLNRTIGNIYGLTISAVQHRKLKLKKEIFGEDDPDVTLEQILDRI